MLLIPKVERKPSAWPSGKRTLLKAKNGTKCTPVFFTKISEAYLIFEKSVPARKSFTTFFTNFPPLVESL